MGDKTKFRTNKGIATFIIFMLIATVLVLIFIPMITTLLTIYSKRMKYEDILLRFYESNELEELWITCKKSEDVLHINITNIGSVNVGLNRIVILGNESTLVLYTANFDEYQVNPHILLTWLPASAYDANNKILSLDVSESVLLTLKFNDRIKDLMLISNRGVIHKPKGYKIKIALRAESATAEIMLFNLTSIKDLSDKFHVPPNLTNIPYPGGHPKRDVLAGMKGEKLLLIPPGHLIEEGSVPVRTYVKRFGGWKLGPIPFGVAVIGYDPSWVYELNKGVANEPRYIILLAGGGYNYESAGYKLKFGNIPANLHRNGWRLKIYNFTGVIRIYQGNQLIASNNPNDNAGRLPLGFWYYGYDVDLYIHLDGYAGPIYEYQRISTGEPQTLETSYEPYTILGDFDGNYLNEFVFITEDATYGDEATYNDYYSNVNLMDYSTVPLELLINLTDHIYKLFGYYPDLRAVTLRIVLYFHDNSYDPTQLNDVDDTRTIFAVMFVDEKGNILSSRTIDYQEVAFLHQTVIKDLTNPDNTYFKKISYPITFLMPEKPGKYYIKLVFMDPYWYEKSWFWKGNDIDLTVGVEVISLEFYAE